MRARRQQSPAPRRDLHRPVSTALVHWRRLIASCALAAITSVAVACDTGAVAVSDCRQIERARCEAAQYCDLGIDNERDLQTCKRFARDDCLHGLEIGENPEGNDVDDCVDTLLAAGECARNEGPATSPEQCSIAVGNADPDEEPSTVCRVIQEPTLAKDCRFLIPPPGDDSDDDTEPSGGADAGPRDQPSDAGTD